MRYSLTHLLIFLKHQQVTGFQGINFCLHILEDEELPDSKKREAIIELLRSLNLIDEEYSEGKTKWLEHEIIWNNEIIWGLPGMGPVNATQVFDCKFINGVVRFEWNLN